MVGSSIKLPAVSFETIRTLIPAVLHEVKSYNLPRVCTQLGIQPSVEPGDETEAHGSKKSYVSTRPLQSFPTPTCSRAFDLAIALRTSDRLGLDDGA